MFKDHLKGNSTRHHWPILLSLSLKGLLSIIQTPHPFTCYPSQDLHSSLFCAFICPAMHSSIWKTTPTINGPSQSFPTPTLLGSHPVLTLALDGCKDNAGGWGERQLKARLITEARKPLWQDAGCKWTIITAKSRPIYEKGTLYLSHNR